MKHIELQPTAGIQRNIQVIINEIQKIASENNSFTVKEISASLKENQIIKLSVKGIQITGSNKMDESHSEWWIG